MKDKPSYYSIIPADVRYDNELKDKAKLLYGEITSLSDKKGYCYASNKYFADLYNVSITTISLLIKNLVDKGYIEREIIYKEGTKEILNRYLKIIKGGYLKEVKDNNINNNNTRNNNNIYIYYENNIGSLSSVIYENLKYWEEYYDYEIIKKAIDICCLKNIRNFKYLNGILNNWKNNNIKTLADIENIKKEGEEENIEILEYNWLEGE